MSGSGAATTVSGRLWGADMKIWLTSDNVAWDARRYRYPAEQMLLTLFPGERPEYPETPIPTDLFAQPKIGRASCRERV